MNTIHTISEFAEIIIFLLCVIRIQARVNTNKCEFDSDRWNIAADLKILKKKLETNWYKKMLFAQKNHWHSIGVPFFPFIRFSFLQFDTYNTPHNIFIWQTTHKQAQALVS